MLLRTFKNRPIWSHCHDLKPCESELAITAKLNIKQCFLSLAESDADGSGKSPGVISEKVDVLGPEHPVRFELFYHIVVGSDQI